MKNHKIILSNYQSDYETRLIQIGILPLMYIYELANIFFIKSITDEFDILDYINFTTGTTRSAGTIKAVPQDSTYLPNYKFIFLSLTETVELVTNNTLISISRNH